MYHPSNQVSQAAKCWAKLSASMFTALALIVSGCAVCEAQQPDPLKPIILDQQTLDPAIQSMLAQDAIRYSQDNPDASVETPEGRAIIRSEQAQIWSSRTAEPPAVETVTDDIIAASDGTRIPIRIYKPSRQNPLPIIVYYHGGGWFIGGIEASDRQLRQLAVDAKAIVVSVEYRLSPEAQYPAAWDDAEAAFEWTVANAKRLGGTSNHVCVGGDSAGGNLSIAVTSRQLEQAETVPLCQILYFPAVDNRRIATMRETYRSSTLFGEGFALDGAFTEYVLSIVFPGRDLTNAEISPLFDKPRKMPPTLIAIAGFDPLRDSQRAYAAKLINDGNDVVYREFPSLIHGFIQHTDLTPAARRASKQTAIAAGQMALDAIAALEEKEN